MQLSGIVNIECAETSAGVEVQTGLGLRQMQCREPEASPLRSDMKVIQNTLFEITRYPDGFLLTT